MYLRAEGNGSLYMKMIIKLDENYDIFWYDDL